MKRRISSTTNPITPPLSCNVGLSAIAPDSDPTSVTSSPSRIQVIPSAQTTSQWKRAQGSRSSRAGTLVSNTADLGATPSGISCSRSVGRRPLKGEGLDVYHGPRDLKPQGAVGVWWPRARSVSGSGIGQYGDDPLDHGVPIARAWLAEQ